MHESRLCRSDRKKRATGGQWTKICRMQFMKQVWPRLFSPRRPRSEGGSLSASAPAGIAGAGGISRPTLISVAEQAMARGAEP
jgi:hypothetical protein